MMTEATKSEERFEPLRLEFERSMAKVQSGAHHYLQGRRYAKRYAYRAMRAWVAMRGLHQPDLIGWIKRQGFTGKTCVDDFMEQWYIPLRIIGEDWRELMHAVEEGMTEKKYLTATDAYSFLHKKRAEKAARLMDSPLPSCPPDSASKTEADKQWRSVAEAAMSQLAELKRRFRELERRNAIIERKLEQAHKVSCV